MARGLVDRCWRVLRSLISETVVFIDGVRTAEAHPEAAVSLAEACMKLVGEAIEQLRSSEKTDEHTERARRELELARDLFKSVVTGEPVTPIARRVIPQGAEGNRVLILDIAHSYTHRAIDSLRKSESFEFSRELLELLSKARRESAPTTLYRLAHRMARTQSETSNRDSP